ncbi:MAG: hypothetical protein R3A52_29090 [Polyangiales bacterium]
MSDARDDEDPTRGVLVVRRGHGANCSSIGSAVEMLFLTATAGAAILAAVSAALRPATDEPSPEDPASTPPDPTDPMGPHEDEP